MATRAERQRSGEPRRGATSRAAERPIVLAGSAHPELASAIARELGVRLGPYRAQRFPDGELDAEVGARVRGADAVLVQPTAAPGGEHLLELLLMADACRRVGARSVSAVIPYMGYARQDHRARAGQALGMRVVGELLARGRFARVIAVDLHADAVEGFLDAPLEHVSAAPLLAATLRARARGAVVVSPDLGAAKRARDFARLLGLPSAIVHKTRTSATEVTAERVIGDVRGLAPIVVDDMIATGGTIHAALSALVAAGATREVTVVATHALLVGTAVGRLRDAGVRRLVVSNTVPAARDLPFACEVVDVAPALADAVRRARGRAW